MCSLPSRLGSACLSVLTTVWLGAACGLLEELDPPVGVDLAEEESGVSTSEQATPGSPDVTAYDVAAEARRLGLEPGGNGTFVHIDPVGRFTAIVRRDGTVSFGPGRRMPSDAHGRAEPAAGIPLSGPLEWMGRHRDRFSEPKEAFLEETRELRAAMRVQFDLATITKELVHLDQRLHEIWYDGSIPLPRRRELLFRLWDECDDTSDSNSARAVAGDQARERIESFVREHAGWGSVLGYTEQELERLNAGRTSSRAFEPYR